MSEPREITNAPDTEAGGIAPERLRERIMTESVRAEQIIAALKRDGVPLDALTADALETMRRYILGELGIDTDDE